MLQRQRELKSGIEILVEDQKQSFSFLFVNSFDLFVTVVVTFHLIQYKIKKQRERESERERQRGRGKESEKKKKSFLKVSGILVYIQPFKATTAYNIAYGIGKKNKKENENRNQITKPTCWG